MRVHFISHTVDARPGVVEMAKFDVDARQVDADAFSFDVVVGDVQSFGPGLQAVSPTRRVCSLIRFSVIGKEHKIIRSELDGLAVKIQ